MNIDKYLNNKGEIITLQKWIYNSKNDVISYKNTEAIVQLPNINTLMITLVIGSNKKYL